MSTLLEVHGLRTQFKTDQGLVQAVDGVSYVVNEQEIIGLVGESGCGKSVSQLSVMQLIFPPGKIAGGTVLFEGKDLLTLQPGGPAMRSIRGGKIAMIFQEPMTSLNPALTIGVQLTEMLKLHLGMSKEESRDRAVSLLTRVGIPSKDAESRLSDYPHQFSGGMRQRVMIAMGLSCNPRILIADEPTTALDVTIQAQLLELMKRVVDEAKASLVLVTHNLGIVARHVNRLYIMYAGRIVESGTCKDVFRQPLHPYTVGLFKSVPRLNEQKGRKLVPIQGAPPSLIDLPPTCAFLPRCTYKIDKCFKEPWPALEEVKPKHCVRCYVTPEEKV
jgi:oligopeptide/dipeptide ABC transporter ATP-binding protein